MTINYNGNTPARTRMLRSQNIPSMEGIACLDGIRGAISDLRNINGDTKTRLQKTLSIINDLANSLQCFYLSARGKLELDAQKQYEENVKKIDEKIKINSKDEKDVLSRINSNNNKITSLRSQNVKMQEDIDALNSLLDNKNLSASERQFYTEQLANCNKAIKDNNKQVDELLRTIKKDKDVLRKITKALEKLSKQKLGQKEAYENALRHIGKLPKNLVKGVRLGKFVKTAGKLAGPLGVFIEAWSLWDDIQEQLNLNYHVRKTR